MNDYVECRKTLGFFEGYRHPTKFMGGEKMRNDIVKLGLVIGILLLFISISSMPTNANVVKNNSNNIDSELNNSDYTNFLGTIYFNFSRFSVDIGFTQPEVKDYVFPVIDGNYSLNFTVELNTKFEQIMLFPRGVFTYAEIRTDGRPIWSAFGINVIRGDFVGAWTIEDVERIYTDPPINGRENVTISIRLQGRGFPFSFFNPVETCFTINVHFVEV
jgi:hypothetical protein